MPTEEETRFTQRDFEQEYEEPQRTEDVDEMEQAKRACNTLARALEDLPEIKKVVETQFAAKRIWLLLRITGKENQDRWANVTACQILHHFDGRKDIELNISKQLFPHVSELGARTVVYGWNFAVCADRLPDFVREISGIISDLGPKLRVAESPLVGPPTPQGDVMVRGGSGRRGASKIGE